MHRGGLGGERGESTPWLLCQPRPISACMSEHLALAQTGAREVLSKHQAALLYCAGD